VFYLQLILAGIATGCIYSLAGMGVVLTYKATGVFNFAHGAIAMFVAYTLWQMNHQWGVPLAIAAPISLIVIGPGIGLLLERFVFRPLARRGAGTSEKLVATLGIFVLLLGLAFVIWTGTVRQGPRLISNRPLELVSGLRIGLDQLVVVLIVVGSSAVIWWLFRRTRLGCDIRAVVDRRELAELAAVDSDRIAGVAWALGCGFAGLTGVLLAPSGLDPYHLTLLVVETFSIAVVARLTSLPIAVGAGILLLGVGQSLLTEVHLFGASSAGRVVEELKPNLSVIILFAALLLYRRLDVVGEDGGFGSFGSGRRRSAGASSSRVVAAAVAFAFVVLPFFLTRSTFAYGHRLPAMVIIFSSIVAVTGFSGQISLGQAAFAGFGAFLSARLSNSFGIPVVITVFLGGLGAIVLGLVAGLPAVKRRGLFLALTTLALGPQRPARADPRRHPRLGDGGEVGRHRPPHVQAVHLRRVRVHRRHRRRAAHAAAAGVQRVPVRTAVVVAVLVHGRDRRRRRVHRRRGARRRVVRDARRRREARRCVATRHRRVRADARAPPGREPARAAALAR
jgi:branched-chain amino acid transport system permease protein